MFQGICPNYKALPPNASGVLLNNGAGVLTWSAAYAPLASPTFTGTVTAPVLSVASHYGVITADTESSGAFTMNLATSDWHSVTLNANVTGITLSNATVGQQFALIVYQNSSGSTYNITASPWFTGLVWAGGTAPTITATLSKRDVFGFKCISSGVYLGFVMGQNY